MWFHFVVLYLYSGNCWWPRLGIQHFIICVTVKVLVFHLVSLLFVYCNVYWIIVVLVSYSLLWSGREQAFMFRRMISHSYYYYCCPSLSQCLGCVYVTGSSPGEVLRTSALARAQGTPWPEWLPQEATSLAGLATATPFQWPRGWGAIHKPMARGSQISGQCCQMVSFH